MRLKAALIIYFIVCAITVVNFGSSLIFTRQSLTETMGQDISLALRIANDLVSTRINLYNSKAITVAERLMKTGSAAEMKEVMREQLREFPDFLGVTVLDRQSIIAEYGVVSGSVEILHKNKYIQNAFGGKTVISTTRHNITTGDLVMYICTPMGSDRVLSITIPGMAFSVVLAGYKLWDSGHIWMLDEEGTILAHIQPNVVKARTGYLDTISRATPKATMAFFQNVMISEGGVGTYIYDGKKYQCAYSNVAASEPGWRIGLSVPLSESPMHKVQIRLLLLALSFLIFGIMAAVVSSDYIAKPFNKIIEQNRLLEELNHITTLQTVQINEAHKRTKLMMDATPICSMLWSRDLEIFDCNEECIKLFGMKDKQDFLDNFFNLSPQFQPGGRLSSTATKMYIQIAFDEGSFCVEWVHQTLDGRQIPFEMTLVKVKYDNDYIVAAYARDLREHKHMMAETYRLNAELEAALKDARAANRAKSSFLAKMSHEMRTPLNAVVGLSELILDSGSVYGDTEDKLGKVYNSGMTLLGIVNDILDISKIESGKFELHPDEYDTPSLINDVISLNIVRIGEKPIQFRLVMDEKLPGVLLGDELRVKQVFNNFLSNAFKYTQSGTVEWKVSSERDGSSVWLVSEIRDTGIGIKKEDISKLFKEYSQVDAASNRRAEGTGLGLSITKRLVEMMDGKITVESEYGKGSVFSVRLRQQYVSEKIIGQEVANNLMSARFTDNKRARSAGLVRIDLSWAHALVVDDMPTNLDVAKGMLVPYGIKIDCATGGRQAVDMIRAENPRYNVVFMDHMMPDMDGITAVRIIREEIGTEYARNVPVIALTANAIVGNEDMFLGKGFQAFISKPIDLMRLDSVLRQWVRNKSLETNNNNETQPEYVKLPLSGIAIEGVDIKGSLKRFAGREETYLTVLRSYALNMRSLLNGIENDLALLKMKDYAIAVHGIKGASYSIGASQAGLEAERLEKLAKAGDIKNLLAENRVFAGHMTILLGTIDEALGIYDSKNIKPSAPDPVFI